MESINRGQWLCIAFRALFIVLIASIQLANCSIEQAAISRLSQKGIVVPKRPAIIAGLEHSFRGRQNTPNATASTSSVNILATLTGSRNQILSNNKKIQQQPNNVLYLDRKQQELLAANPNYADLAALKSDHYSAQPSDATIKRLFTKSSWTTDTTKSSDSAALGAGDPVQNQYRGYSLIELEIGNEQERNFVQDLYANLSAAMDEQAKRPQTLTVSPYAEIDFWSFKSGVNDHIDLMVSPKSRHFIIGQLARAKIKYRVKIEDIQARLEQQNAIPGENSYLSGRKSLPPSNDLATEQKQTTDQDKLSSRQNLLPASSTGSGLFMNDSLFFENYQRLADINQYLETIVGRARDVARVQVIGRSSQGRYLRVLRLGYDEQDNDDANLWDAKNDLMINMASNSSTQPKLNASKILDNFVRRQKMTTKLGSIWLDGGTHAREWISPATVLYMAFRLTENHARCLRFIDHMRQATQQYGIIDNLELLDLTGRRDQDKTRTDTDLLGSININEINTSLLSSLSSTKSRPRSELEQKLELLAKRPQDVASEHGCDLELEQLLRRYTFFIQPVINPDGYEYSHTNNRLWRKTRSTNNHPIYRHFCLGADPNRNYDARHGSTGSSSHPCSQTYGGTTPFTEPETRHQSNFVYAHRSNMKMYISFHSYSQMILLPYSHSKQLAPDHKDLESVGQAAVKAIERTHGTQYRVGPSASILYTASGTASDWAYEKAGIKYSYTIELRDTGSYGFLLPKQQIVPTGEETFNGLLAMIDQMEKNDHLLTSKSSPVGGQTNSITTTSANHFGHNITALSQQSSNDYVHAPDLDQLRPFGRFRQRPAQLENVLDGSQTWATPEPRPPGVRDRKPAPNSNDETMQANRANNNEDEAAFLRAHPLEEETITSNENEPDSGMTFEGEGELMEPTNRELHDITAEETRMSSSLLNRRGKGGILNTSASVAAALEAAEQAQLNIRSTAIVAEKLRKITEQNRHTLSLSSGGRSLINNPPQGQRFSPQPNRRESSEIVKVDTVILVS